MQLQLTNGAVCTDLQAGDKDSLPQFEQLFEGAEFRKGMELAFTNTKAGGLAARIDSRDVSGDCVLICAWL